MQEYEAWVKSDDDPELLNAPAVLQWQQLVDEATVKFGKKLNMADTVKQRFIDGGFKDVREDVYKVCLSPTYQCYVIWMQVLMQGRFQLGPGHWIEGSRYWECINSSRCVIVLRLSP